MNINEKEMMITTRHDTLTNIHYIFKKQMINDKNYKESDFNSFCGKYHENNAYMKDYYVGFNVEYLISLNDTATGGINIRGFNVRDKRKH